MRLRTRKISRFRHNIAWLAVTALVWASGQQLVLSSALGLSSGDQHCVMLPTGGEHNHDGSHQSSEAPAQGDHGFCPVCSLSGCCAAALSLAAGLHGVPALYSETGRFIHAAEMLRVADYRQPPPARAPPLSV